MDKTSLGDRMKEYENISRIYLTRRMPLIIRIDGKAFHTFTRGFKRPFDPIFIQSMQETAKYLCENIMGCKLAYVQSDEISLLLTDYDELTTQPWFGKNLQKIVSVSASMATAAFNRAFIVNVRNTMLAANEDDAELDRLNKVYLPKFHTAMFDARAFVLPKEEVCNYFIWRQQDAIRNSIQSVGQANFSHAKLNHKTQANILVMLESKGINWEEDFAAIEKRGTCCLRKQKAEEPRSHWETDIFIPVFTEDRSYIESLL